MGSGDLIRVSSMLKNPGNAGQNENFVFIKGATLTRCVGNN